jgi:hypothetical protein
VTETTLRVFISYARQDGKELALRLHDDLKAVGYAPWLDLSEIQGGASWSEHIEDAIEACDVMLALMTAASYKSDYCRAEQLRAIRKGKRIIPLLGQPDSDRPIHLEPLNYIDFSDVDRYEEKLRDLLSDITAGRALRPPVPAQREQALTKLFKGRQGSRANIGEKRDASAFRRYIADLRRANWLGSRYWWPYFLFSFADMPAVVEMLKVGALLSPARASGRSSSRWDESVRLYFRPRTPDLWSAEGIRPMEQRRNDATPLPVYLLFDMEAVLCQQNVRFGAADPAYAKVNTYTTASAFNDLPFEMIYHDSYVRPDEREEVMQSRRAQVIVPGQLGLESLQYIWLRSNAEYDTLRAMLPADLWRQWRDKITTRTDYTLFHRRWTYVDEALLTEKNARLRFNMAALESDRTFEARAEAETSQGRQFVWTDESFVAGDDLIMELSSLDTPVCYTLRFFLDDTLAYMGQYQASDGVL